jgi:hypothetical protein
MLLILLLINVFYICKINIYIMKYTIEQYKILSKIENHKIIFDGYDYWWYSKKHKTEDFTVHCIIPFNDYKNILVNIYYWVPKYYKLSISLDCVELMLQELFVDIQIKNISNSKDYKTNKKIKLISELNPNIRIKELCLLLNISKVAISKHLKKIYV